MLKSTGVNYCLISNTCLSTTKNNGGRTVSLFITCKQYRLTVVAVLWGNLMVME
uniref:Uncharacterized protein n=1 Tax=Zea mays TaxID=4577 RepID=C4J1B7_MAIZE|nr:unknown [Zea mays]